MSPTQSKGAIERGEAGPHALVCLGELRFEQISQVRGQFLDIKLTLIPCPISRLKCGVVRLSVFADSLGHDLLSAQHLAVFHAYQVVARRSCGSSVALDEWVYPVQPPEGIRCQISWMFDERPILVYEREESILGTSLKCGGKWFPTYIGSSR